jgi:hypothetical protein
MVNAGELDHIGAFRGALARTGQWMPQAGNRGQYVYVVCSTGSDHFAEMAAVSAATLRFAAPQAYIAVLTDRQTTALDSPGMAALRTTVDNVIVVDCEGDSAVIRSRALKIGMRRLIRGPLLYLDSDTIVMRSPDDIWYIDCDVAAAPDLSPLGQPYPAATALPNIRAALGWSFGAQPYLNAGVIRLADNDAAQLLMDRYHASWLEFRRVMGQPNEQPAFNRVVAASLARLTILPASYNAQIPMNAIALLGATIVHYYSGNFENRNDTIAHTTGKRLKSSGTLDLPALRAAIDSGNPWTRIDSYRKAVATRRYWRLGQVAFDRLMEKLSV